MSIKYLFIIALTLCIALQVTTTSAQQLRIACVGNSITYGSGIKDKEINSYPAQLDKMSGEDWQVRNFGVSGATMLKKGDKPYWEQQAFQQAQDFKPDIVIIKLGTNDSKPQNWQYHEEYVKNYLEMIRQFKELSSSPQIFICLPVPAYEVKWGINPEIIKKEMIPAIKKVARKTDSEVINLFKALKDKEEMFPDKIHPNKAGAKLMAETIYEVLVKELSHN